MLIFLGTQGYCGRCKESAHTIFKDCPQVRASKPGKPGFRIKNPKKEGKGTTTT
jgi:hypothetical protein